MSDVKEIQVGNCARCGGYHDKVEFRPFKNGSIRDLSHWAMCPTTVEPILMRIQELCPTCLEPLEDDCCCYEGIKCTCKDTCHGGPCMGKKCGCAACQSAYGDYLSDDRG